jgi:hypothetical protein
MFQRPSYDHHDTCIGAPCIDRIPWARFCHPRLLRCWCSFPISVCGQHYYLRRQQVPNSLSLAFQYNFKVPALVFAPDTPRPASFFSQIILSLITLKSCGVLYIGAPQSLPQPLPCCTTYKICFRTTRQVRLFSTFAGMKAEQGLVLPCAIKVSAVSQGIVSVSRW